MILFFSLLVGSKFFLLFCYNLYSQARPAFSLGRPAFGGQHREFFKHQQQTPRVRVNPSRRALCLTQKEATPYIGPLILRANCKSLGTEKGR